MDYKHKTKNWYATPYHQEGYYKVYKGDQRDYYTRRSSLEIENSEDWVKQLSDDILRLKIKEAEESGFSAGEFTVLEYEKDGQLWFRDPVFSNRMQYGCVKVPTLEYLVETPPADFKDRTITKVRRESDGEAFSVGDMVSDGLECGEITKFYPAGNYIEGFCVEFEYYNSSNKKIKREIHLSEVKKAYEVEDGWVCEGDTVWIIHTSWSELSGKTIALCYEDQFSAFDKDLIIYKNERAAKDFIERYNTPAEKPTYKAGDYATDPYGRIRRIAEVRGEDRPIVKFEGDNYWCEEGVITPATEPTTEELLAEMENQRDSAWDTLEKIEKILAESKKNR